jgi:hypothetical protein
LGVLIKINEHLRGFPAHPTLGVLIKINEHLPGFPAHPTLGVLIKINEHLPGFPAHPTRSNVFIFVALQFRFCLFISIIDCLRLGCYSGNLGLNTCMSQHSPVQGWYQHLNISFNQHGILK